MTDFPRSIELPPGADTPSFDEYRWSQLVEENKRIISVLGAMKSRLDTLDGSVEAIVNRVEQLGERLAALESIDLPGAVEALDLRLRELAVFDYAEALTALNRRLTELEDAGKPPAKPVDETNAKIVEFLNSAPDVKFTAITIRENLGIPAKYIHDRCKTLVRQGLIRTHVAEGRHPFYQALEKKAEPVDGQPA